MMGYIAKGQRLILMSLSAMLLLFLLTSSACLCIPDGSLEVNGKTYEWIDAPAGAASKIYIEYVFTDSDVEPTLKKMQENIASDISKVPLNGVEIAIGLKESIEKIGEEYYHWETHSDVSGNIDDYWMVTYLKAQLLVRASKSGYMEVLGEAEYGGIGTLVIIVILVKDNNQN